MSIQTSARYYHDESDYRWPIPFTFSSPEQVGVSIIGPDGTERRLNHGADFSIAEGLVICTVPRESWISIWLSGPVSLPPVNAARSTVQAALEPDTSALDARAETLGRQMAEDMRQQAEASLADMQRQADARLADMQQQAEARIASASQSLDAAGEGYEAACKKLALQACEAAHAANRAAATASLHHHRPGIAVVADVAEIKHCPHGLYIINPHITHEPTPFYGIWPAACVADMNFDAIFFIGEPYPDRPGPVPPPCGCRPKPPEADASGDSDDWLPCDHHKPQPACICGKGECNVQL